MKVRVKPILAIPHSVNIGGVDYTFSPDSDLSDDKGKALIATYPDHYEEAKGKSDLTQYRLKDRFKGKTVQDIVNGLSEAKKLKALEFVKQLAEKEARREEEGKQEEGEQGSGGEMEKIRQELGGKTIEELREFALEKGIELPGALKKKDDIIAFIESQLL